MYNTATQRMEEIVENGSLSLDYSLLLGAGMYVSESTFVGIRSKTGSFDATFSRDALPTSAGGTSIGGMGPYEDLHRIPITRDTGP